MGLAQLILYSLAVLHGRRREWRRQTVDGVEALVAADFGPAVIGWRRFTIVLPAWVLELTADARALVVRHEVEHVRRRDPRLLMQGALIVLAMPWHPALWWQYRRLRRAIELDCDARVVGAGADVGRYGEVLLEASGFCRRGGLPAVVAFAERAQDLEARIKALTPRPGKWRALRVSAAVVGAAIMVAAACTVPDPLTPDLEQKVSEAASRPETLSSDSLDWVRSEVRDLAPAETVMLVRSSTGELLGKDRLNRTVDGVELPLMQRVVTSSVDRIELIKGSALALPGISAVIVITLKPGAHLMMATGVTLKSMLSGQGIIYHSGGIVYRLRRPMRP